MAANQPIGDGGTIESIEEYVEQSALIDSLGRESVLRIVLVLHDAPAPLNPHDIAESAGISRNAFYENRDVLVEYGLMEQAGSAGNSPLFELGDTDTAEAIVRYAEIAGARRRKLWDAVIDVVDDADEDELSAESIAANLKQVGEPLSPGAVQRVAEDLVGDGRLQVTERGDDLFYFPVE